MTAHQHQKHEQNAVLGILFMLLNTLSIAVVYAVAKELTQELSSHLVVFLYKASILVLALPWCFSEGLKSIKTNRLLMHASRGFLSISGSLCLYYALKHIDLVDITAIGYLEQVILAIIGILYFKEKSSFAKLFGIFLSFIGAVIVIYPDIIELNVPFLENRKIDTFNPYYVFVFFSIIFWATNCTVVKILGRTEKTKVQLFYVLLFSSMWAFPLAFMKWEVISHVGALPISLPKELLKFSDLGLKIEHCKYIAILALCYFIHSVAFFKALQYADLSTVIPFDYSRIVFAGLFGYFLFGESPSYGSYIGYTLIIISGIYIIQAEAKRRRKLKENQILQIEEEFEHA